MSLQHILKNSFDIRSVSFQLIYKAQSKQDMAKVTTTADSVDIRRVKWAQQLVNQASSNKQHE